MSEARRGALHMEHVFLGARFEAPSEDGALAVSAYGAEKDASEALEGAALVDLTGCVYLLLGGPGSAELSDAALAGPRLSPGQAAFEAVLAGDGRLVSVPLCLRTGPSELVLLDASERGAALEAWLDFLRSVEAGGVAPYAEASIDDATEMLVPLALVGSAASLVLSDYVGDTPLPREGEVRQLNLDAIPAVVGRASVPERLGACYVLLVPPAAARRLWRSLLSFTEVSPVGHEALRSLMAHELPWGGLLGVTTAALPALSELSSWGLARRDGGYVGARALKGHDH